MKKYYRFATIGTLTALSLGGWTASLAQEAAPSALTYEADGRQVFTPAYFQRFGPQTAADMVRALPGFLVRYADSRRGLGQGGANVLIDGDRVSGKSTDPMDVLSRTSFEAVVRVEIVDGATLGISGLSGPVANVVLDRERRTGNFEWNPQFRKGLASRLTNGSLSVSGKKSGWSYTLGAENNSFRAGAWGDEFVTGPDGELLEYRYEQPQPKGERPSVSVALEHEDSRGRKANINGKFEVFDFEWSEISDRFPTDPAIDPSRRIVRDTENEWNTELSADYAFDAFGGRTKIIGFQYLEHSPFISEFRADTSAGFDAAERFERTVDEGETIVRLEQTWERGEGRSFEVAAEGVFNFNEAESALFEIAEDGAETEVDLDGANSRIEERRGEISGTYNFPIGEKLDIQASLAMEYSELSQSGDQENERSFTRPKGFVSATYELTPTVELRGRVERRVGQLNFFAFASSINLVDDITTVGNVDLVPEQSWFLQAALQKKFADDSQMTLTFDYEDLEDIVQRIPIGDGDGVGNVPEAQRWRLEFIGTQMLERFGVPGAQVEWDVTFRGSEILDPFTAVERRLNGETKLYYSVQFRHDIPNTDWAYGIGVEDFENAEFFRRDQISLYDNSKPTWEAYIEHKDLAGFNATAYIYNFTNYRENFRRDIFDGPRPDGAFVRREARSLAFDPIVGVNISRTF